MRPGAGTDLNNVYGVNGQAIVPTGSIENSAVYGNQSTSGPTATTTTVNRNRTSNTADAGRRPGRGGVAAGGRGVGAPGGLATGLDGVEPSSNMAHHMQLVNSIINDGSLHNLVFSNGSLNTEYLQQTKS